eukprot:12713227-Prorocentrum_lima.AAC.1
MLPDVDCFWQSEALVFLPIECRQQCRGRAPGRQRGFFGGLDFLADGGEQWGHSAELLQAEM